jgi:hypothetical protein
MFVCLCSLNINRCCLLLQGLRIVWLEGRMLLKLLNGFYATVAADVQHDKAAAAAADGSAVAAAGLAGGARTGLPVLQAVSAASEVAVLLASFLQSFLDSNSSSYGGSLQHQQQQQEPGSSPCCILLPENLVGPHGAVNYMNRVQQQASLNPGRQAATK